MSTINTDPQRGFAIVSAIFILVVLAGLAGFVVSLTTTQSMTFAQDIQGARAYLVARTGIEWGLNRWLTADNCTTTGAPTALNGFTLSISMTELTTTTPHFCTIEVTATSGGSAGSVGYVERQLRVVVGGT